MLISFICIFIYFSMCIQMIQVLPVIIVLPEFEVIDIFRGLEEVFILSCGFIRVLFALLQQHFLCVSVLLFVLQVGLCVVRT